MSKLKCPICTCDFEPNEMATLVYSTASKPTPEDADAMSIKPVPVHLKCMIRMAAILFFQCQVEASELLASLKPGQTPAAGMGHVATPEEDL